MIWVILSEYVKYIARLWDHETMISQHEQKIFTKVNSTKNNNKKKPEITRVIFHISEKNL